MLRMPRRYPIDLDDRVQVRGRFGIVSDVLPNDSTPLYRVTWVGNKHESQDTRSDWLPASSLERVVGCCQPGRRVLYLQNGRKATVRRVFSSAAVQIQIDHDGPGRKLIVPAWQLRPAAFPSREYEVPGRAVDDRAA